ncbi:FadR/GntR family transcriptional regulator [Mycolicibacterium goodii]|uniref:FadR family transcriptional regulator n=1 Tax=Mycolicibacterium goodii TaxID=134601 RepID=A0ABS6HXV5_MYCGD|nr:FadR/GntR family transcriptional regulator [Mycolicibacterium goodii]OKH65598.1 GntR family transcriptional regulator [Mycobacterium sp. SWH-M5]MBU8810158.1 FadR family transcriptional regulator [Mycolicibacterium goodii]MBU8827503.1 FadR family transcriptional regulator [Mycolicibacterium goodii]MBU8833851.1 FadR family transcriptional regulator [Mycolicibacterium goodii]MBU8841335.1 FadR family transcriptional regulator [Mycolicibacterium goodii]
MPLATTRRTGLVDQVIEQLRASVSSGEWPIGTKIPTEPELAEALGVGRNTLREAVRALAHGGILEVRQGDGTYVRATSEVSGALSRLCGSELREVLQVRRCLEVEGARLAATARTDADLAELRTFLERTETSDHADFVRSDTAFHLAVVRASHNGVLIELYRGLIEAISASVATTSATPDGMFSHRGLVEAIAAGDVERAGREAGEFLDALLAGMPAQSD